MSEVSKQCWKNLNDVKRKKQRDCTWDLKILMTDPENGRYIYQAAFNNLVDFLW